MENLAQERCIPCEVGAQLLGAEGVQTLLPELRTWTLQHDQLSKEFTFQDFRAAIAFVNRVADVAEVEGHHPDISINYNKVRFDLTTHKIHGLSRNDFILAAKIDRLLQEDAGLQHG